MLTFLYSQIQIGLRPFNPAAVVVVRSLPGNVMAHPFGPSTRGRFISVVIQILVKLTRVRPYRDFGLEFISQVSYEKVDMITLLPFQGRREHLPMVARQPHAHDRSHLHSNAQNGPRERVPDLGTGEPGLGVDAYHEREVFTDYRYKHHIPRKIQNFH